MTDFVDPVALTRCRTTNSLCSEIVHCPRFRFETQATTPDATRLTLFNEASYSLEVFGRVAQLE